MKKGGYKIIDFADVDIKTDGGATVSGVYSAIEDSYRKAILISGITLDGVEKRDCFVCPEITDSNYTFTAYGKTFTITNTDAVTIA